MRRYEIIGTVREYTFFELTGHGFTGEMKGQPLYAFVLGEVKTDAQGHPDVTELFPDLDHAIAAAIAEKYTGKRGAGGTAVGTAADWFMRMIGAGQLVPVDDSRQVLANAARYAGVGTNLMTRLTQSLREQGYTLAKLNTGR